MTIKLYELLEKYNVDYSKFPEGILTIEFNKELDDFDTYTHDKKDVYIFTGEYIFKRLKDKDLIAEVKVKIDLRNLPSKKKIDIVKDIYKHAEEINYYEKYNLSLEEICLMDFEVFKKRPETISWKVKGNVIGNYYEYNLFGGLETHS